jgi:hypothetical protein
VISGELGGDAGAEIAPVREVALMPEAGCHQRVPQRCDLPPR